MLSSTLPQESTPPTLKASYRGKLVTLQPIAKNWLRRRNNSISWTTSVFTTQAANTRTIFTTTTTSLLVSLLQSMKKIQKNSRYLMSSSTIFTFGSFSTSSSMPTPTRMWSITSKNKFRSIKSTKALWPRLDWRSRSSASGCGDSTTKSQNGNLVSKIRSSLSLTSIPSLNSSSIRSYITPKKSDHTISRNSPSTSKITSNSYMKRKNNSVLSGTVSTLTSGKRMITLKSRSRRIRKSFTVRCITFSTFILSSWRAIESHSKNTKSIRKQRCSRSRKKLRLSELLQKA